MQTPARLLATLATVGLGIPAASAQTTLLNNTFTNAGRTVIGSPATAVTGLDADTGVAANTGTWNGTDNNWVVSSDNAAMAGSTGSVGGFVDAINVATTGAIDGASLRVINLGAFYDLKTHFSATTLAPGESISVSFNVRTGIANPSGANGFRVGLFNSGGTRQTANLTGYTNNLFNDDTGYVARFNPNATATTTTSGGIQERSGGNNNGLFQGTLASLTNVGTPPTGGAINFDTNYAVTFSIARSLDGLTNTISSSFGGVSITATDAASPYTSFDQLGIFFGSGWGAASPASRANFIDDVVVSYTAIPEPSAFAALAGLGAMGLAGSRRRARR